MNFFRDFAASFSYQMQLDILDILPFVIVLSNVWKIHSSAGISRHFVGFTCASAALSLITSRNVRGCFIAFTKFFLTLILYCSIKFKFPLKSDKFRDPKWTFLIIPVSLVLSLFAFPREGLKSYLSTVGHWFNAFAVACQVTVTKQSRRITLLSGYFVVFIICKYCTIYLMVNRAFNTSGSEMWYAFLCGATSMVLSIDLLYFAYYAKQRIDDFELPSGQFTDFN
ncbi:hypothetical protein TRFO_14463 [Tritrichomonas foetus]|uniref:ER lumen protein retaining receptor n=1 Tax=Tritrichomonas foetus TaxID=1144522 RepID=A0A1J4KV48_9EUKA|nr:hypothetical protein TRFO_14463 [Tritrichomonas foetus]|eukprot:OHT15107.1 hypothetical protein TRFO_14463 [Tritrichomonas foetus]